MSSRIGSRPSMTTLLPLGRAALALGIVISLFAASAASAAPPPSRDTADACPSSFPSGQFSDVRTSNVHRNNVDCIVGWAITSGTSAGMYSPSRAVTRGQMASFLARLVERTGGQFPSGVPDAFDDDNGSVHESNSNRMAAAGIMSGTSARRFSPSQPVNRGEMATWVARIYQYRSGTALPPAPENYFADDNGNPNEDSINRLAAAGIVGGRTSTQYVPNDTVPRDAMGSFLARLLDALVEAGITRPPVQAASLGRCNAGLDAVVSSGGWNCDQISVNGTLYLKNLNDFAGDSFSPSVIEFDLSRDFTEFTSTLGISDDSTGGYQVNFEVLVDGASAFSQTIGLGTSVPVSIDVTDALRLRLVATPINVETREQGNAVFADPTVS